MLTLSTTIIENLDRALRGPELKAKCSAALSRSLVFAISYTGAYFSYFQFSRTLDH